MQPKVFVNFWNSHISVPVPFLSCRSFKTAKSAGAKFVNGAARLRTRRWMSGSGGRQGGVNSDGSKLHGEDNNGTIDKLTSLTATAASERAVRIVSSLSGDCLH